MSATDSYNPPQSWGEFCLSSMGFCVLKCVLFRLFEFIHEYESIVAEP